MKYSFSVGWCSVNTLIPLTVWTRKIHIKLYNNTFIAGYTKRWFMKPINMYCTFALIRWAICWNFPFSWNLNPRLLRWAAFILWKDTKAKQSSVDSYTVSKIWVYFHLKTFFGRSLYFRNDWASIFIVHGCVGTQWDKTPYKYGHKM